MIHCLNISYLHNMYSCKLLSLFFFVVLLNLSEELLTDSDRIRLKDVDHITFAIEKSISSRGDLEPVSQLECIGGSNQCKWLPEVIDCFNRGLDRSGKSLLWDCNADLHFMSKYGKVQVLKFNQTSVTCEGYNSSPDEYISVGSCRLQYSLDTLDGWLHYNSFWQELKDRALLYGIICIIPIAWVVGIVAMVAFPFNSCKRQRKPSNQIIYER